MTDRLYAKHPEFGFCRGLANHLFRVSLLSRDATSATVTLRCSNCTARRIDLVSMTNGAVLGRHYVYPQGYHLKARNGKRVAKAQVRLEYLATAKAVGQKARG